MKKILTKSTSLILVLTMILSIITIAPFAVNAAETDSESVGSYYYVKDGIEYELFNDGTAKITDYGGDKTDLIIPSVISVYTVTVIGDYAFEDCTSLTSITIPDSVTSIGYCAFGNCTSLEIVNYNAVNCSYFDNFHHPFSGCTSLSTVNIGESVEKIPEYAFYNCTSLESVTIGSGVTSIGGWAFSGCTSLTSIKVGNQNQNYCSVDGLLFSKDKSSLIKYPAGSTSKTYSIPDSVTTIGDRAFGDCESLASITIPDSVTTIGDSAFNECASLESITIPESVTSIDWYVFCNCTSLASVTIPDSVTTIGGSAFYNCTSLASITIPDGVTSIGNWAFGNCASLESITIPDSVTYMRDYVFCKCTSLASVTIPDSVTTIGYCAFGDCESLESITIPDSVTSIGESAFEDCTSLASVTIPDSVTSIGESAFEDCTSLESVTIPDSVTSIGRYAFENCTSLKSIKIPDSETYIGKYALGYTHNPDTLVYVYEPLEDFTIYSYTGSTAESYAKNNGFTFIPLDSEAEHTHTDESTDISVTLDKDVELLVEKLTDSESIEKANIALGNKKSVIGLYDISLVKGGAEVQPDGTATVKIPTANENARVYRLEADGSITDMNAVYDNGYMVFATEHFSLYALVVPKDNVMGDVNFDGTVNIEDATEIQKYLAELKEINSNQELVADVNSDGIITIDDATQIQKYLAELIPSLG